MLKNTRMVQVFAAIVFAASYASASFIVESTDSWNNQVSTPDPGQSYVVKPGITGANTYWYWAQGISFNDTGWTDINGGQAKGFGMKYEFSQAITSFQFVTPETYNAIVSAPNYIFWNYSTDGVNFTPLWQVNTGGALQSLAATETPVQTFAPEDNVTRIWLSYGTASAAYVAMTVFDGTSEIRVTTVPEPVTMVLLGIGGLALLRKKRV